MNSPITAKVAAAQIIALVNSRPATPGPQEVEAIIARVLTCPDTSTSTAANLGEVTPALAALYAEWDRVRVRYESAEEDAEVARWADPFGDITEKLLAFGARSLADLRLLLPAVVHWNSPLHVESPDYPYCIIKKCEDEEWGLEQRSPAYFIQAVIGLLGGAEAPRATRSLPLEAALPTEAAEFRRVAQECRHHHNVVLGPMTSDHPGHDAAEALAIELLDRVSAMADRILAKPLVTWDDYMANALIFAHYADHDLDELGAAVPLQTDPHMRAAEKLALAILHRAPDVLAFSLSPLAQDTREVEHAIAACEAAVALQDADAIEVADNVLSPLSREVWSNARHSPSALRAAALIAKHWHHAYQRCADDATGEHWDGPWRKPSDCGDWGDRTVAELIDAVLRFGTASRP